MSVLAREADIVPVGSASGACEFWPLWHATRPDVVLVDLCLPEVSGAVLCRQVKALVPAPAALIYSATSPPWLALAGALAGADGVIEKGVATREFLEAIRTSAGGTRTLLDVSPHLLIRASARMSDTERDLARLLVSGMLISDAAAVLGLPLPLAIRHLDGLLARLYPAAHTRAMSEDGLGAGDEQALAPI
jgi:DNA-binding NarL/FixJ family response regulator